MDVIRGAGSEPASSQVANAAMPTPAPMLGASRDWFIRSAQDAWVFRFFGAWAGTLDTLGNNSFGTRISFPASSYRDPPWRGHRYHKAKAHYYT
jgi:hypothetical protein